MPKQSSYVAAEIPFAFPVTGTQHLHCPHATYLGDPVSHLLVLHLCWLLAAVRRGLSARARLVISSVLAACGCQAPSTDPTKHFIAFLNTWVLYLLSSWCAVYTNSFCKLTLLFLVSLSVSGTDGKIFNSSKVVVRMNTAVEHGVSSWILLSLLLLYASISTWLGSSHICRMFPGLWGWSRLRV